MGLLDFLFGKRKTDSNNQIQKSEQEISRRKENLQTSKTNDVGSEDSSIDFSINGKRISVSSRPLTNVKIVGFQ